MNSRQSLFFHLQLKFTGFNVQFKEKRVFEEQAAWDYEFLNNFVELKA